MVKAVIFDFDGVLVDSEHINVEGARQAFETFGYRLAKDDEAIVIGRNPKYYVPAIIARHGLDLSPQPVIEAQWQAYGRLWPDMVQMIHPMKDILTGLKERGLTLALATTNDRKTVRQFVKKFRLPDIFSAIVTEEDVSGLKPDPEVYLKAAEKLGVPKENILAVEDTAVGLAAAKNAGLRCAVLPNRHTENHDFSKADFILKSPEDLLNILNI